MGSTSEPAPHAGLAAPAQPTSRGRWAYLALVLIGLGLLGAAVASTARTTPEIMGALGIAAVFWFLWAALLAWLVSLLAGARRVAVGVRFAALGWGAICLMFSGPLVGLISRAVPEGLAGWRAAIAAPIPEEAAKLLGVAVLATVVPRVLATPRGAVVCGFLSGLGFTVMENWFGTGGVLADAPPESRTEALVGWLFERSIQAPWSHLAWTGLAALGVWYVLAHPARPIGRRLTVAAGFFILAVALHALGDGALALGGTAQVVAIIGTWLIDLGLFIGLVIWSRRSTNNSNSQAASSAAS